MHLDPRRRDPPFPMLLIAIGNGGVLLGARASGPAGVSRSSCGQSPFAERDLWNMSRSRHPSGFAPENLTTLAHFSVSSAMSLLKSGGEPANTVPPRSAIRALIRGSVRATLISLLSLSMISVGVFLGAATPCQPLDSYPGTKSPTVGVSGNTSERAALVTANARNLPPLC